MKLQHPNKSKPSPKNCNTRIKVESPVRYARLRGWCWCWCWCWCSPDITRDLLSGVVVVALATQDDNNSKPQFSKLAKGKRAGSSLRPTQLAAIWFWCLSNNSQFTYRHKLWLSNAHLTAKHKLLLRCFEFILNTVSCVC